MSKLREKRVERGLTLSEAARQIDTNVGNLSRIERGQQFPRPPLAFRLCRLYGLSLEEIFTDPKFPLCPATATNHHRRATDPQVAV